MHELGIAQGILDSVRDEAERAGAKRVVSVDVEVGELMQLDIDALRGALTSQMLGPELAGAKVSIGLTEASFSCSRCGSTWGMGEARMQLAAVPDRLRVREPDSLELPLHFLPYLYPAFVRCPKCGSSDSSILQGEDVRIRRMELE